MTSSRPPEIYKSSCLRRWYRLRLRLTSSVTGEPTLFPESIKECMYVDANGWTALHKAAYAGAPCDVIDALVNTYPPALAMQTKEGWTPLNLACLNEAHKDVVLLLARYGSDSVEVEAKCGRLPLHCACIGLQNTDYELIEKLVRINPMTVLRKDEDGFSPLHLACLEYKTLIMRTLATDEAKNVRNPMQLSSKMQELLERSKELRDCWEKFSLLIQAAYTSVRKDGFKPRALKSQLQDQIVHRLMSVVEDLNKDTCSFQEKNMRNLGTYRLLPFLRFAIILHPRQLKQQAENELTPHELLCGLRFSREELAEVVKAARSNAQNRKGRIRACLAA